MITYEDDADDSRDAHPCSINNQYISVSVSTDKAKQLKILRLNVARSPYREEDDDVVFLYIPPKCHCPTSNHLLHNGALWRAPLWPVAGSVPRKIQLLHCNENPEA